MVHTWAVVAVAGAWLVACAAPQKPTPAVGAGVHPEELAARVNDIPITRGELARAVERHLVRYRESGHELPPSIVKRVRESVLQRMVEDSLVAQKAEELGLTVTDEELERALVEYEARFRSPEAFSDYLARSHRTVRRVRAQLRRDLLRTRVVGRLSECVEVTDAEVRAHYEANRERYVEREQIRASRILLHVSSDVSSEQLEAARALASEIREQAASHPDRFAELARLHSHGTHAARGGQLGWVTRGRMPPAWDQVVFALEPGAVSPVLRTDESFEIVAVWDRREARHRALDEVADLIRETLAARKTAEKRRAVLRDLTEQSEIEVFVDES